MTTSKEIAQKKKKKNIPRVDSNLVSESGERNFTEVIFDDTTRNLNTL